MPVRKIRLHSSYSSSSPARSSSVISEFRTPGQLSTVTCLSVSAAEQVLLTQAPSLSHPFHKTPHSPRTVTSRPEVQHSTSITPQSNSFAPLTDSPCPRFPNRKPCFWHLRALLPSLSFAGDGRAIWSDTLDCRQSFFVSSSTPLKT